MFHEIIRALLPVFLGMALGYFAGWRKLVDNRNVSTLNVLLMQFALPLTLFSALATTPQSVIVSHWHLMLVLMLSVVSLYCAVLYLQLRVYRLSLGDAAVQALTVASPNYTAIGLPLLLPIFGNEAALLVAVAIAVGTVTTSPLTLALLDMHAARRDGTRGVASPVQQFLVAMWHSVRKPIFVGPALGLLVSFSGVSLPGIFNAALAPMTQATGGIGLFLTGLMLSAQPIRMEHNALGSVGLKNVCQPLLAFCLAWMLQMPSHVGLQAMLLTAMPAGFFGLVYGATVSVQPRVSGTTLVVSSLASAGTLSLALAWFNAA